MVMHPLTGQVWPDVPLGTPHIYPETYYFGQVGTDFRAGLRMAGHWVWGPLIGRVMLEAFDQAVMQVGPTLPSPYVDPGWIPDA